MWKSRAGSGTQTREMMSNKVVGTRVRLLETQGKAGDPCPSTRAKGTLHPRVEEGVRLGYGSVLPSTGCERGSTMRSFAGFLGSQGGRATTSFRFAQRNDATGSSFRVAIVLILACGRDCTRVLEDKVDVTEPASKGDSPRRVNHSGCAQVNGTRRVVPCPPTNGIVDCTAERGRATERGESLKRLIRFVQLCPTSIP